MGIESLPWEFVQFKLMRDVYRCTPEELDRIPFLTQLRHLAFMREESAHNAHFAKWRAMNR